MQRTFGESGEVIADGSTFEVRKDGWLSGEWILLQEGEPVVEARKTSLLRRRFELSGPAGNGVLEAVWAFRTMQLDGAGANCRIRPVHFFTRMAVIEGSFGDFRMVAFAFWLTVLLWRRGANSNASGSA